MTDNERTLLLALADFCYAGWGSNADRNVINRHLASVKEASDALRAESQPRTIEATINELNQIATRGRPRKVPT